MTDLRSGYDEDSLPWLQEVEDEDGPRGISARGMLIGVLVVLVAAAAIGTGFYWLGSRNGGLAGEPELIRAPDKPYKVKPENPGGLDVTGESQTTFETSAGHDVDSRLNLGATGREDVTEQDQPEQAQDTAQAAPDVQGKARRRNLRRRQNRPALPARLSSSAPSRIPPRHNGRGRR